MKGNVEKPSDYDGVLYIPLDDSGGWKMELIKELKAAGFDVDAVSRGTFWLSISVISITRMNK